MYETSCNKNIVVKLCFTFAFLLFTTLTLATSILSVPQVASSLHTWSHK